MKLFCGSFGESTVEDGTILSLRCEEQRARPIPESAAENYVSTCGAQKREQTVTLEKMEGTSAVARTPHDTVESVRHVINRASVNALASIGHAWRDATHATKALVSAPNTWRDTQTKRWMMKVLIPKWSDVAIGDRE